MICIHPYRVHKSQHSPVANKGSGEGIEGTCTTDIVEEEGVGAVLLLWSKLALT